MRLAASDNGDLRDCLGGAEYDRLQIDEHGKASWILKKGVS